MASWQPRKRSAQVPEFQKTRTSSFLNQRDEGSGKVITCLGFSEFFFYYGGILALRAHCALLLDYVPPEEPPGTPLGNTLRIR